MVSENRHLFAVGHSSIHLFTVAIQAGSFVAECLELTSERVNPGTPLENFINISLLYACGKGAMVRTVEPD